MLQELNNVDILGLCETFFNRNVDDGTINIDGYKMKGTIEIHSAQSKITLGAELLYTLQTILITSVGTTSKPITSNQFGLKSKLRIASHF